MESIEISEVLNQMVRRACLFEVEKMKPTPITTTTTATTTTTTTTAYRRKGKAEVTAEVATEMEMDQVLVQSVEAAYPNLVSNSTK